MADADKCWECGRRMVERKVPYSLYGVKIGVFPALVCPHCNEPYFSEATAKRMTELSKRKGLWGLETTTKVGKAGSTLDIRLSKKIIQFMDLEKGKEVTIYPESKRKLVISI